MSYGSVNTKLKLKLRQIDMTHVILVLLVLGYILTLLTVTKGCNLFL